MQMSRATCNKFVAIIIQNKFVAYTNLFNYDISLLLNTFLAMTIKNKILNQNLQLKANKYVSFSTSFAERNVSKREIVYSSL